MAKVSICGVTYRISHNNEINDPEMAKKYGYCDYEHKSIVLNTSNDIYEDKRTLRHEILHAFLDECGLSHYSCDEKLVTFFEMQLPKLFAICKQLDILEDKV